MKYDENIKVVTMVFFKILVHLNFSMKYEVWSKYRSRISTAFFYEYSVMAAVLSPENRIFQDLTVFFHPFIINMKYEGSINVMEMVFFYDLDAF